MRRLARATTPLPHLDEAQLQRLWAEGELSVGSEVDLDGARYRVLGWDPFSVLPGRVYVEDVSSGRQHALVVRNSHE